MRTGVLTIFLGVLSINLMGCEQILGKKPTPEELQEEAKAIGGGCRHVGRSLEDCYKHNPDVSKSGIYAGWKEMHEYMIQQKIDTAPMVETESPEKNAVPDKSTTNESHEPSDKPAETASSDESGKQH